MDLMADWWRVGSYRINDVAAFSAGRRPGHEWQTTSLSRTWAPGACSCYLVSSVIIGFWCRSLCLPMLSYFCRRIKFPLNGNLSYLVLLMLLNSLIATLINALIVQRFKSVDSHREISDSSRATSGFLVGTYIPIGNLPDMAQNLMKPTPSLTTWHLFGQLLMKESLTQTLLPITASHSSFWKKQ